MAGRIIAAAQEVYHTLGPGFREIIYQRAMVKELPAHDLEFDREVRIDIYYKGVKIGEKRVDFIVGDSTGNVMVEIEAKSCLEDVDFVQTLSYLEASGYQVARLINFGGPKLEVHRPVNSAGNR